MKTTNYSNIHGLTDRQSVPQFTAAINGHHEGSLLTALEMTKAAIHTHVSKWVMGKMHLVKT